MNNVTLEEIRNVIALSDLPDEQLQWLLDHCEYRQYEDGQQMVTLGQPMDYMWIMIEGTGSF